MSGRHSPHATPLDEAPRLTGPARGAGRARRGVGLGLAALLPILGGAAAPGPMQASVQTQTPAQAQPLAGALSEDEAVAQALLHNPALRAFRRQRAVAEGEVLSATAVENPRVQLQLLHAQDAQRLGWGAQLKWAPPQPVEWAAQRSRARAHATEIRAEIAEQEWALAAQVRTQHATLLALREQERLSGDALALRQRVVALLRTRVERGASTRIELNLGQLAAAYAQRDVDAVELRRTQAEAQLRALLGVLSAQPLVLQGEAADWTEQADPAALDPAALGEQALARRPALQAARARVQQAEQGLRIEKTRRWPWLELSGRYRHNTSASYLHDVQLAVELALPIFNTNTGPIQVATATRDQEQDALQAQAQALLQSVYAACAELKVQSRIWQRLQREVLPALVEHERLMEIAARGAEVDLVALLGSEESVLRARREHSEARLGYRQAWQRLAAALGGPVGPSGQEVAQ